MDNHFTEIASILETRMESARRMKQGLSDGASGCNSGALMEFLHEVEEPWLH